MYHYLPEPFATAVSQQGLISKMLSSAVAAMFFGNDTATVLDAYGQGPSGAMRSLNAATVTNQLLLPLDLLNALANRYLGISFLSKTVTSEQANESARVFLQAAFGDYSYSVSPTSLAVLHSPRLLIPRHGA